MRWHTANRRRTLRQRCARDVNDLMRSLGLDPHERSIFFRDQARLAVAAGDE